MQEFDKKINTNEVTWRSGLQVFTEISSWIIAPIILAVVAGEWFDNAYLTEPWGMIGFSSFGFLITIYGIVRAVKNYAKKIKGDKKN